MRKPDPSAKPSKSCSPVLGIRAIVVRIRIRNLGSVPITNGTNKKLILRFMIRMRIRNSLVKKSQNIKMYVFLYFCLLIKMQDMDTIKGMAKNIRYK